MKHKSGFNALNMRSDRRKAVKRSMVTSVFKYERIKTTKARALEIRRMAEKMITRAKEDSVQKKQREGSREKHGTFGEEKTVHYSKALSSQQKHCAGTYMVWG